MFPIPDRMAFSEISRSLFDALNIDNYGAHYENDVFYMHPYCWCESDTCPQCVEPPSKFNLYHKASGFGLTWYKYHLRSAETNQEITLERYQEIIDDCIWSLDKGKPHDANKVTVSW